MTTAPRDAITRLLTGVRAPGTFAAQRTATADDLHLEVKGLGRLRFPVSRAQALRLCAVGRPARYGRGEKTLLDTRVRDTCEIPIRAVKIDKRRWNRTLGPMLRALGTDLGLPSGSRLEAALHGMLVYGPGQFFLRHQDSEKADDMVGTLVVTLPSAFRGGAFVIEHKGETVTCRGSRQPLSFVAFYADCHHQVLPVRTGFRVVLTYDLTLAGKPAAPEAAFPAPEATIRGLATRLREHFETPLPPRPWEKGALPREPPSRLVYLLDHQYTERGLGWHRLKGDDVARVGALRAAAERAGCDTALALAEVHETWSCEEEGWDAPVPGAAPPGTTTRTTQRTPAKTRGPGKPKSTSSASSRTGRSRCATGPFPREAEPSPSSPRSGTRKCAPRPRRRTSSPTPPSTRATWATTATRWTAGIGAAPSWRGRESVPLPCAPRPRPPGPWRPSASASGTVRWTRRARWRRRSCRSGGRPLGASSARASSTAPSVWGRAWRRRSRRRRSSSPSPIEDAHARAGASVRGPRRAIRRRLDAVPAPRVVRSIASPAGSDRDDRGAWLASLPRLVRSLRAADEAAGPLAARLVLEDRWGGLKKAIEDAR